jgi:hypothetical protein
MTKSERDQQLRLLHDLIYHSEGTLLAMRTSIKQYRDWGEDEMATLTEGAADSIEDTLARATARRDFLLEYDCE